MTEQNLQNEFSRVVTVSRISPKGIEDEIEASPKEREELAKRFSLIGIDKLKAKISLTLKSYFNKQAVVADGSVNAAVRQQCVFSLEEITSLPEFSFSVIFVKGDEFTKKELSEIDSFSPMDNEEIEVFYKGKIDIGELVAQQLFVHLEQHPRKEDKDNAL